MLLRFLSRFPVSWYLVVYILLVMCLMCFVIFLGALLFFVLMEVI